MCIGCVPFIYLFSRFAMLSRRLNSWSKTHLSISEKIKSFCTLSAVPFSTSVQNEICSFENCRVHPRSCENRKIRNYLKLYRFRTAKQKKRGKIEAFECVSPSANSVIVLRMYLLRPCHYSEVWVYLDPKLKPTSSQNGNKSSNICYLSLIWTGCARFRAECGGRVFILSR